MVHIYTKDDTTSSIAESFIQLQGQYVDLVTEGDGRSGLLLAVVSLDPPNMCQVLWTAVFSLHMRATEGEALLHALQQTKDGDLILGVMRHYEFSDTMLAPGVQALWYLNISHEHFGKDASFMVVKGFPSLTKVRTATGDTYHALYVEAFIGKIYRQGDNFSGDYGKCYILLISQNAIINV